MADFRNIDDRSLADLLADQQRDALDAADPRRVVQDLQIHQIELELQNRELRAAQQALEESRDRYADLYDFAPVAYATLTRQSRITQMNLTAAQLLGVERGHVPELVLATRLAPGDGRILLASLVRVLDSGDEESIEVTLGHPLVVERHLRLVIRREGLPAAGEPATACRVVLLDVTEIKRAQAVVLNQQRFLQSVVDGIADPIRVIGVDQQVLLMNAAARAADGGTDAFTERGTAVGGTVGDTGPNEPGSAPAGLASGAETKDVQRRQGADGQMRWIERISAPLRGPAGEIAGVIESSRDITEHLDLTGRLKEREVQLEHLAHHDALTGLPNRLLFADRLKQAMLLAHRDHRQVAVLFLDLDRFKVINNTLGHPAGDQVLKQVAQRMRALVPESDTIARLGGDEFAILLVALEEGDSAGLMAHQLLTSFAQPFPVAGQLRYVTASIGISLYPADGDEVAVLERNADAAMYRAKEQRRGSFRFYTEEMTARAFAQVTLEDALRQAISRNEFVLNYQPQHNLDTGGLVGVEALIRWHHPLLGLIGPERFLPLAESSGLTLPIGVWVVQTAAAQMKVWQNQGLLAGAAVWVNLSNRDIQNPNLTETIECIVKAVDLEPGSLAVEITETLAMASPASAAGAVHRVQGLGIKVGIDAFGTGYSALAAVDRLALREFKIDRSFVTRLPDDPVGCAIARAAIALGRALELRVVAEGIETQAQADFLKTEGCRIGQGHLFSPALPAAEFAAYVRSQGAVAAPIEPTSASSLAP
jgi:diguanylate cyclase (GGDEF)-like protein